MFQIQSIPTPALFISDKSPYSVNFLSTSINIFDIENDAVDTFAFPNLAAINNYLTLNNITLAQALSFPSLVTLPTGKNITIENSSFTSLAFARLTGIAGTMLISSCTSLATLNLSALTSLTGSLTVNATAITSFSSAITGGTLSLTNNPSLTSVTMNSYNAPVARFQANAALSSLALSAAQYLPAICYGNTALANVTLNSNVYPYDNGSGWQVNFSGCALPAATVNFILHRCALFGAGNGGSLNLSGGTNAAPTGQGLVDKAALIADGASVLTN